MWLERRPPPPASPQPPAGEWVGYWDYGDVLPSGEGLTVVQVDENGAWTVACATTPGDQLKHLECPPGGPCAFIKEQH